MCKLKLLKLLISITMVISLTELYVFLMLPIHVFRNVSFNEGLNYWNCQMELGKELMNFSTNIVSEQESSEHFRCALTLTGRNTTYPPQNYIWVKVYQYVARAFHSSGGHPLVESSTLKLSFMITEMNLRRLMSTSDAAAIYVGFMISNNTASKCYMVYTWALCEPSFVDVINNTLNEYAFWRIVRLERFNKSLSEDLVIKFRRSIWQDFIAQGFPVGGNWKINQSIEVGIMLWNVKDFDFPWSASVYLGCVDITYYWPPFHNLYT